VLLELRGCFTGTLGASGEPSTPSKSTTERGLSVKRRGMRAVEMACPLANTTTTTTTYSGGRGTAAVW